MVGEALRDPHAHARQLEWILWMDSDAIFTNMTFALPLEKYKDHNMVVQGWDNELYDLKNWVGLNTGPSKSVNSCLSVN